MHSDTDRTGETVLTAIKESLPELRKLLARADGHWGGEDGFYRFYHQSFKVYGLQKVTEEIVAALAGRSLFTTCVDGSLGPRSRQGRRQFSPF